MFKYELPEAYMVFAREFYMLTTHEDRLAMCEVCINAIKEEVNEGNREEALKDHEEFMGVYNQMLEDGHTIDDTHPMFYLRYVIESALGLIKEAE